MNEYYTTMDYSNISCNYNDTTSIKAYPVIQSSVYQEAYKIIESLITNVAKIFTR